MCRRDLLILFLFIFNLHETLDESLRLLVELLVLAGGHSFNFLLGHRSSGIRLHGSGGDGSLGYRLNHVYFEFNLILIII